MRLLVGIDFSPLTDLVVAEATSLARATAGSIVLVHVARTEPVLTSGGVGPPGGHRVPAEELGARRETIEQIAAGVRRAGVEAIAEVRTCDTDPHAVLLEEIDAHRATYAVIGSHGHSTLHEVLIGSTTRGVLRGARVPVLVIPDPRAG